MIEDRGYGDRAPQIYLPEGKTACGTAPEIRAYRNKDSAVPAHQYRMADRLTQIQVPQFPAYPVNGDEFSGRIAYIGCRFPGTGNIGAGIGLNIVIPEEGALTAVGFDNAAFNGYYRGFSLEEGSTPHRSIEILRPEGTDAHPFAAGLGPLPSGKGGGTGYLAETDI
jgi:hypothetical protein